jgi:hypothetical protein
LRLAKLMKSELNVWYMDDGTLGGDADVCWLTSTQSFVLAKSSALN